MTQVQPPPSPRASAKPSLDGLEDKWARVWEQDGTYRFDRDAPRERVYSIDTPPPTVSGSLHVGHVFSYTHTDVVARFKRMSGLSVFYPMGWDDNGLPTERRVQNYYGVQCDPSLPYDPDFTPPEKAPSRAIRVSRRNFVELCNQLTALDEQVFEDLWRYLGVSVDWNLLYATISDRTRGLSQRAFLRNFARGEAYSAGGPTLWDVTYRTAVAQAELEDREEDSAYHRLVFQAESGPVHIETTRPELLPACVALVAHPDDERYQPLFGTEVTVPLFGHRVPVRAHKLADPEKGTGVAMVCTFGDMTDVIWWRELNLPTRAVLDYNGRVVAEPPADLPAAAQESYAQLAGKTSKQAREVILELLRAEGGAVGEPRAIRHPVKFYERGDKPLEIITTRQWYIRNGGRDEALQQRLLELGRQLEWHPEYMRSGYENWVSGLNGDWLVSRQRFFGVPIPLWYPLDADGEPNHDAPIVPAEDTLPVDPSSDVPPGYTADQRGAAGGFVADPDVLDTWATSSLSPLIAAGWGTDDEVFAKVFPMDLRPQGHDIIRTWLFSTVLRSHLEFGELPWKHAAISGWILDPDRKKMSKSKGNVVTPKALLEEFGSDAVRYWAASGRPGADTSFDTGQMKIGRRLAIKILNASRFVLTFAADDPAAAALDPASVTEPLDVALLARLAEVVGQVTTDLEGYDYTRALERVEQFFWFFCDDYVELVKSRAYGDLGAERAQSAQAALGLTLSTLLRLFAPFLPFVTEEVWSWWRPGSVHHGSWPTAAELAVSAEAPAPALLDTASSVLRSVRKSKSDAKVSMVTPVSRLVARGTEAELALVRSVADDLSAAGRVAALELTADADELTVAVEF
ncbi:valine--tRNA ligase [Actinokineospora sp. NBRC 105648]|uniref:valine--tRNA ligase n=1 Tax=Actinokineospora sp. NBRC 105648 TaxID=3032206 RepID=UPI0024A2567C|nr:valine--tRNA ligase [Actinokineospora sp. NBRC 105648]GLZ42337.1 valine--tRNA ligase [Actinokineospora sp. NBRC 105648]